ncbi:Hsp20/alpha crystallin family protein [Altibacter sp.]|uniref:Hsp20/alpha crystallin family protein n=1 Tax=Altibacter sp. TaxID=2024823 RepID=UPI000C96D4E0|nr:Hsp20/alpha crystallin family protein [Altibacter sp.]MAP53783.1 molecular chaperone Hsp20 [Altibacter sp.]|tara:strand:+ start:132 stop:569 length:438 start_codon:yes stop_codon:yes gene_type:complete
MKIVNRNKVWFPSIFEGLVPENRLDVSNYENFSIPYSNIKENFSTFVIELAAPGLKKENIAIEIEKEILKVSSKSSENEEEIKEEKTPFTYTRKDFDFTNFERSFALPETVKAEEIEASYTNGIVTILIPKKEAKKEIKRMVEIS